ncbi:hypothetical protein MHL31_14390 [Lutibacter sp. A80]|uniref:hypothetical protein n=1 Tax=Lutibacter sp. A80 TaxID=2918453 RepID=UPI001F06860F|nr:hypothetical protein [Lutibacter sp. A80]UMB60260.1 hypothetical protein MHL31_14390 [Lutibacter sp. A80]
MIDYTNILLIKIDIERLLKSLPFKFEVVESTGEYSTKKVAEYHFCKITIYESDTVVFTGSIHKLYNSLKGIKAPNYKKENYKGFNGNQFTINNILEVKEHLQNLFNCKPQQMLFQNIEFGTNATTLFNPNIYLKGLLYHINKPFEFRFNGTYAQAEHQRYRLKIYNKSIQYGMNEFTLRVELKINKYEEFKKVGIRTFSDVNTNTLNKAKELLLRRFDEVVQYDYTINKKALTKREKQLIKNYSNPRYWLIDLKPNYRFRHKQKLHQIIIKKSKNLHQQLKQEMIKKCSIINRHFENPNCSIINHSSIELNMLQNHPTKTVKKCPITGIELTREKESAKYIRTSTLKHLYQNDKTEFKRVCNLLLNHTINRQTKFENNIIQHLAKQVRNRFYNRSRIKKTGYKQKKYKNQIELSI